jgi:serine/threonine protein phosphatase 1
VSLATPRVISQNDRLDEYVRRFRGFFSWLLPEKERGHEYPPAPDGVVIYAIGDIHGRADLLETLGAKIDQDSDKERPKEVIEIYLGDYIDRGPDTPSVIDWLLKRQQDHNVIFLRGNHELVLEEFLAGESAFKDWRQIGGYETLVSYGVDPFLLQGTLDDGEIQNELASLLPAEHRRFLNGLATAVDLGAYFFVHAGVRPGIPLDGQSEKDCLWIRDEFLDHEEEFGHIVVHGHSPVSTPEFLPNRINLDTAAYATGRLSCLKISEHGARLLESNRL